MSRLKFCSTGPVKLWNCLCRPEALAHSPAHLPFWPWTCASAAAAGGWQGMGKDGRSQTQVSPSLTALRVSAVSTCTCQVALLSLAQESAFLLTGRTHQWKYCLKCSPQPCRLALAPRCQSPRWASHCVWDVGLVSMRLWGSFLSPCCRHKRQGLAFHGHNYEGTFEGNLSATKECYPQNRMKNPVLRDKSRE